MNKTDLIKKIACRLSLTQKEAREFINVYETTVVEALLTEGFLRSQGFGTFSLWEQTERLARNPKKGLPVLIPARNSIKFKPGKVFLDLLNKKE